jgi:hypothetical protein
MTDSEQHQMDLEQRQQIIETAVKKAYKGGLINREEAWAIGYESGVALKLED